MRKAAQLNILNRIAELRLGPATPAWYRLNNGRLEYNRNGAWTYVSGTIEDNIHTELNRALLFGVATNPNHKDV